MPPLERAVALEEVDDVAVLVAEHLHLDVPRLVEVLLDEDAAVLERGLGLGRAPAASASPAASALRPARMPRPPPPAAALMSTG